MVLGGTGFSAETVRRRRGGSSNPEPSNDERPLAGAAIGGRRSARRDFPVFADAVKPRCGAVMRNLLCPPLQLLQLHVCLTEYEIQRGDRS